MVKLSICHFLLCALPARTQTGLITFCSTLLPFFWNVQWSHLPLQACFHRGPVSWALRAYLPNCVTMQQLVAGHQYEQCPSGVSYAMDRVSNSARPPYLSPSLQFLWLWAHWGPKFNRRFPPQPLLWFCYNESPLETFTGRVHPSSHIIAYFLLQGMLFSQKVCTQARAKVGPQDVWVPFLASFMSEGESFPSPEQIY